MTLFQTSILSLHINSFNYYQILARESIALPFYRDLTPELHI